MKHLNINPAGESCPARNSQPPEASFASLSEMVAWSVNSGC